MIHCFAHVLSIELPTNVFVDKVSLGGEGILFISKFLSWAAEATLSGSEDMAGNVAKSKFDKLKKMVLPHSPLLSPHYWSSRISSSTHRGLVCLWVRAKVRIRMKDPR